jgi:RNA polymerase sigma-70 factor (ECF subfamily)
VRPGGATESRLDDDELMARGAAGDEDAFRVLVERWQTPAFRFLERMLGSREDAQDLVQETFLRMCLGARRYRPEGRFQSWLFRIAGNLARSQLRRRKILRWVVFEPRVHQPESPEASPQETLEQQASDAGVRDAILALPDRQRQAMLLRTFEEMSYQEIASAMGTSVGAVESLLHRATTALRRELERRGAME